MKRLSLALGVLLPLMVTLPAPGGIFFGKHGKPNPAERVPQLIATVKTDQDEDKRAGAAKELREFDPAAFPEVVAVLIDVLQHDSKVSVRAEAVQSLGKLRPISQEAGWALEQATRDSSFRVRWQARNALIGYRISGYRSPGKTEELVPKTAVPNTGGTSWIPFLSQFKRNPSPSMPQTGSTLTPGETPPPPLAQPIPAPAVKPTSSGVTTPVLVPTETPKLQAPPAQSDQGPDLPSKRGPD
jgi:hypothetical protein